MHATFETTTPALTGTQDARVAKSLARYSREARLAFALVLAGGVGWLAFGLWLTREGKQALVIGHGLRATLYALAVCLVPASFAVRRFVARSEILAQYLVYRPHETGLPLSHAATLAALTLQTPLVFALALKLAGYSLGDYITLCIAALLAVPLHWPRDHRWKAQVNASIMPAYRLRASDRLLIAVADTPVSPEANP